MKKILSLVLALALVLTAVSALAADTEQKTPSKQIEELEGKVKELEDANEALKKAAEAAQKAAEEAKKAAEAAQKAADEANKKAEAAQKELEAAKKAAEEAEKKAAEAEKKAEEAAKAAEEAAKKAAEEEAAKKAAEEAAKKAEEDAKKAAEDAKKAEEDAKKAAEDADLKAQRAHNFGQGWGSSSSTEDEEPEIGIEFIDIPAAAAATIDVLKAAFENGDLSGALAGISVPENYKTVNEVAAAQFTGECAKVTKDKVLNIKFNTPYEAGKEVLVLIGIIGEAGVEWEEPFKGVGKDDGSVDVTVPAAVFTKVLNNPFLVAVISE